MEVLEDFLVVLVFTEWGCWGFCVGRFSGLIGGDGCGDGDLRDVVVIGVGGHGDRVCGSVFVLLGGCLKGRLLGGEGRKSELFCKNGSGME